MTGRSPGLPAICFLLLASRLPSNSQRPPAYAAREHRSQDRVAPARVGQSALGERARNGRALRGPQTAQRLGLNCLGLRNDHPAGLSATVGCDPGALTGEQGTHPGGHAWKRQRRFQVPHGVDMPGCSPDLEVRMYGSWPGLGYRARFELRYTAPPERQPADRSAAIDHRFSVSRANVYYIYYFTGFSHEAV